MHSVSRPEHSYLKDSAQVEYHAINDKEALAAFSLLSKKEGIIPALETSHALAYLAHYKMHGLSKRSLERSWSFCTPMD